MTTTYDPHHPKYYDETDMREELTRVYELCQGCRMCVNYCPSFPTLFDAVDRHDLKTEDLTIAEQDQVVDECFQCKICYVKCPYVPPHEWELDFPRLMLRATATRKKDQGVTLTDRALAQTDLIGKISTALAPLANASLGTPGSFPRKIMEKVVGVAAQRILPLYTGERFSAWFKKRGSKPTETERTVALFPTCLMEYQDPSVGHDAVKVYERNKIACTLPEGQQCCGIPWLDQGNVANFQKLARENIAVLADSVRAGQDIVVLQPTCGYVLKKEYPAHVPTEDSRLVAEHTYDVSEYLMKVHREREGGLDKGFTGTVPETVTWHAPCHLRAQEIGFKSRDLIRLTGAQVKIVDKCSGIDGTWGLRAENYLLAKKVAQPLKEAIESQNSQAVAGDCRLANNVIFEETGRTAKHPVQLVARAYGIPEEPGS
ncbi:MAG: heterodisulfide reductase-related iron-sulfur binding cluster [Chloroflexota bacterium]